MSSYYDDDYVDANQISELRRQKKNVRSLVRYGLNCVVLSLLIVLY